MRKVRLVRRSRPGRVIAHVGETSTDFLRDAADPGQQVGPLRIFRVLEPLPEVRAEAALLALATKDARYFEATAMLVMEPFRRMGVLLCVGEPRPAWSLRARTQRSYSRSPVATPCPGIRSAAPASSWPLQRASLSTASPHVWNATQPRSGGRPSATPGWDWPTYWPTAARGDPDEPSGFPPL